MNHEMRSQRAPSRKALEALESYPQETARLNELLRRASERLSTQEREAVLQDLKRAFHVLRCKLGGLIPNELRQRVDWAVGQLERRHSTSSSLSGRVSSLSQRLEEEKARVEAQIRVLEAEVASSVGSLEILNSRKKKQLDRVDLGGHSDEGFSDQGHVDQRQVDHVESSSLVQALAAATLNSRLPVPEPAVFVGDPLVFQEWRTMLTTLVERHRIPPRDRLFYLKQYVGGSAKKVVDCFFSYPSDTAFEEAISLLIERYGDPFVIAEAYRDRLGSWKVIGNKDYQGLREFSDFLRQIKAVKFKMKELDVLDDARENQKLLQKIPAWMLNRWKRKVQRFRQDNGKYPSFDDFCDFVEEEARIQCDPVTNFDLPSQATKTKANPSTTPRRSTFQTSAQSETVVEKSDTNTTLLQVNTVPNSKGNQDVCICCEKSGHGIRTCRKFADFNLTERKQIIFEKGLCFGCLKRGHRSKDCRRRLTCEVCQKPHPTLMHDWQNRVIPTNPGTAPLFDPGSGEPNQEKEDKFAHVQENIIHLSSQDEAPQCSSMILPVYLSSKANPGTEVLVYALLDTQSDATFVVEQVVSQLPTSGTPTSLLVSTITSDSQLIESKKYYGLTVRGHDSKKVIDLPPTFTRAAIPANRDHIPMAKTVKQWPHLCKVADHLMPKADAPIGILIGYNCSDALAPREVVTGPDGSPFAWKTDLGWGVIGISDISSISYDQIGASHHSLSRRIFLGDHRTEVKYTFRTKIKETFSLTDVQCAIERDFLDLDVSKTASAQDRAFLQIMQDGIKQESDGHYKIPLPLKPDAPDLPNNKMIVQERLNGLKKKFNRDPAYFAEYKAVIDDLLQAGHAEEIPQRNLTGQTGRCWYLPHHGVLHPTKKKLRVVYDCSSRFEGISLNDILLQGPDMMNALLGVLLRFRLGPFAFCCDIEKMFLQFRVQDDHRDLLRFLWWNDGNLENEPSEFRMCVHLFGATSSPACAAFCLRKTAEDGRAEFGDAAADFLLHNFYVDDGLVSVQSEEEASALAENAQRICAKGGLRLCKFVSNSEKVLSTIPEENRETNFKNLDLRHYTQPEKVLGMRWCVTTDSLMFDVSLGKKPVTRRGILSTVSSIFDPLGLLSPFVFPGKQILQELCAKGMSWDDPIPEELESRWNTWREDMMMLNELKVARCMHPQVSGNVVRRELHHFSDASMVGYSQCSYLRQVDDKGQVHCTLCFAKSRVAPLKPVTVPRLELQGAVLSVRASAMLKKEVFEPDIIEYFWTDSKVVLGYIQNEARRFHIYVANRLQEIHNLSSPSQWRHVKGTCNPADIGSRGLKPSSSEGMQHWFEGPDFLKTDPFSQEQPISVELSERDPEVKRSLVGSVKEAANPILTALHATSSWLKAKKIIAIWCRFLRNLKRTKECALRQDLNKTPLSVEEMQAAETVILQHLQSTAFPEYKMLLSQADSQLDDTGARRRKIQMKSSSNLFKLDPYISQGVIRVGGRIRRANVPCNIAHPILLPKKHHLTSLIIDHYHQRTAHSGRGTTLNEIRANGYWIIQGRSAVASWINKCVTCRKLRARPSQPMMSDLPAERLEPAPPFTHCGVDFFGPFLVKVQRSHQKRYGCLFTCLSSRAIHIEVSHSMDTSSFINAYRRFVCRRGPIRTLRCDRGTNFIGTKGELDKALNEMDNGKIRSTLLKDDCDYIEFKANVPKASHMGGVWERMIGCVRRTLDHLLPNHGHQLDDEQLNTLMCEAESIVNSRPLTYVDSHDADAPMPLSPMQLLTMKHKVVLPPPGKFEQSDVYTRRRWRRVQFLANEFWLRWKKEYLQALQTRPKWQKDHPESELRPDDIVLLQDDCGSRCHWPLARVITTTISQDGRVRKATVKTADRKSYDRPCSKLILLFRPGFPVG